MSKWEMVRLGDVAIINMGQSPKSSSYNEDGDGLPFYQGNANFGVLHPNVRYYCSEPTKIATKNDVLLSVRAPIGALNIAFEKCCIGRGLAAITSIEDKTDYKFLYYVLKSKYDELNLKGTGSTFKAINKQNLSDLLIQLPPLEIQKKIAKTLDTASELINLRKQQLEELDNLIRSVFYDMFGDPVLNEKRWELKELKDVTTKIGSGATPRGGKESYKDTGLSLIRSMNVYDGEFIYDDLAFIDEGQAKQLDNVIVEEEDVLLNITGASVTRSCIVPNNVLPARVNQHVSIIRPNKNILNHKYLNNLIINYKFKQNLLSIARAGGATREALTKVQLEQLSIPLPPLPLQNKFADIVSKIEEQKSLVQKSIDESQYLFDSLMSKYFD